LCHGDLHPGNVLVDRDGPVVIDWFDAAVGSPVADVARTSLLIRPPSSGRLPAPHLPGASDELLATFHLHYVEQATGSTVGRSLFRRSDIDDLLAWERVLAAGRLAEHTTADRADLLAVWRSSDGIDGSTPSALSRALREVAGDEVHQVGEDSRG
jgi:aminoglycoside phosphotransferase (APT) family kinase protein